MTQHKTIPGLIINSPYEKPSCHWAYDPTTKCFDLKEGRRPAGYIVASPPHSANGPDDSGVFFEIEGIRPIRERVGAWRGADYPGVTGITRGLLKHWHNKEKREGRQFFFCQLEAVETLIWITEGPEHEKVGLEIGGDGGPFRRWCTKMATGSGKTVVMAMVIAWQVLNKATYPQDTRFSKSILIVTPGLTVKSRLQVLIPQATENNYYKAFHIVPPDLSDRLRQAKVLIHNWHALNWETEEKILSKKSVDKRGALSDEAYARTVLKEMWRSRDILVINDEAHHAWRASKDFKVVGVDSSDKEVATKWIGGLDRIHQARGIKACYDFSATPFIPTGKSNSEHTLFEWIVSDFGLTDAIESGLVKTPRVVIGDDVKVDTKTYKSRLYHIYGDEEVCRDLARKADPQDPLPDLVKTAYSFLGADWQGTKEIWDKKGPFMTPVMITVANSTHTAARVKYAFDKQRIHAASFFDPTQILHIDSKVIKKAENPDSVSGTQIAKKNAELLRRKVDTIGQVGQPGEQIQHVISVGMLTEGWDARTVTHIMGLRAFSSQLLCEQVVGRGLRRASYDVDPETKRFVAEYVNVFGIPFTFLPHEGSDENGNGPRPDPHKFRVEVLPERAEFKIRWPNVTSINRTYKSSLSLNWDEVAPLELDASQTPQIANLGALIDGQPSTIETATIDLRNHQSKFRMQSSIFEAARDNYDQISGDWQGGKPILMAQLVRVIEQFVNSDRLQIVPELLQPYETCRQLVVAFNVTKIVFHIQHAIQFQRTEFLEPVFDQLQSIGETSHMPTWYTTKRCVLTAHSHINFCVCDSEWEATAAEALDRSEDVLAWVKINDHIELGIQYMYRGTGHTYHPDFLIKLRNGTTLILEVKGLVREKDETKRNYLDEWVRAVNADGRFGYWAHDMLLDTSRLLNIIHKHTGNRHESSAN